MIIAVPLLISVKNDATQPTAKHPPIMHDHNYKIDPICYTAQGLAVMKLVKIQCSQK